MKYLLLAAAFLAFSPVAANAAILINGNFEAGGGSLAGWTVTNSVFAGTGADYSSCCGTTGSEPAYSSNHFASFGSDNVTSINTLEQSFSTVAGKAYTVMFDYGALGGGAQSLNYLIDGNSVGAVIANANNNMDTTFSNLSFGFTGNGSVMTLGFSVNSSSDGIDPIIDNVKVTAIPEPESWALMIAGFGLTGAAMRRRRAVVVA